MASESATDLPAEVQSWIGQARYEEKTGFPIEMGYVQKPLKDGAGNYEFSAYIKQYEQFFMTQQEKRSAK